MKAVLSGRVGAAVLLEDEQWLLLRADCPDEPVPIAPCPLGRIFGQASDIQVFHSASVDDIRAALDSAHDADLAYQLALILLDGELEPGDGEENEKSRFQAVSELEHLLAIASIATHVNNTFSSAPLPGTADLPGAFQYARDQRAKGVLEFLNRVSALQPVISRVHDAWQRAFAILEPTDAGYRTQVTLLRGGAFRELVEVIAADQGPGDWLVRWLREPTPAGVRNYREVIQAWGAPFELQTKVDDQEPRQLGSDGAVSGDQEPDAATEDDHASQRWIAVSMGTAVSMGNVRIDGYPSAVPPVSPTRATIRVKAAAGSGDSGSQPVVTPRGLDTLTLLPAERRQELATREGARIWVDNLVNRRWELP